MTNHSGDTVNASQPFEKQYITSLQPGAILWLPRRERMPDGVYIDPDIQDGAFNHPCVVLSIPSKVNIESVIEIAYITSKCKTLPSKNRNWRIRASYLRIVTAAKPFAKDCLHFKNGFSMARDYSNVFLQAFRISVKALELYGRGVTHVLTKQSLTKLLNAIKSNCLRDSRPTKERNGQSYPSSLRSHKHAPRTATTKRHATTRTPPLGSGSRNTEPPFTRNQNPPKQTMSGTALPRGSSKTSPVIVISDTEPENEGLVVPRPRSSKRLSISGVSQESSGAVVTKRRFKTYDFDDDGVPTKKGLGKGNQDEIGESEDDREDKGHLVKRRRKS